jgi:hypothetical protein
MDAVFSKVENSNCAEEDKEGRGQNEGKSMGIRKLGLGYRVTGNT